ncbi:hypothetical protein G9A89_013724 [Geosiphon pyriformis]|nr:hypothetical protein G9A89_013724 [Geosiphon pyriformis]
MLGALATNCILTRKILQTKALKFAEKFLEKNNFKASDGWLEKFKKHHNLYYIKIHGKANSVLLEILPKEREKLCKIISEYDLNDVYNADKTTLFFRMPPNTTLATKSTSGTKEPSILSNIMIRYLPFNTTSHLQLLDAGIIASFKTQYQKLFFFHLINQYDDKILISTVILKNAVDFLINA